MYFTGQGSPRVLMAGHSTLDSSKVQTSVWLSIIGRRLERHDRETKEIICCQVLVVEWYSFSYTATVKCDYTTCLGNSAPLHWCTLIFLRKKCTGSRRATSDCERKSPMQFSPLISGLAINLKYVKNLNLLVRILRLGLKQLGVNK